MKIKGGHIKGSLGTRYHMINHMNVGNYYYRSVVVNLWHTNHSGLYVQLSSERFIITVVDQTTWLANISSSFNLLFPLSLLGILSPK